MTNYLLNPYRQYKNFNLQSNKKNQLAHYIQ